MSQVGTFKNGKRTLRFASTRYGTRFHVFTDRPESTYCYAQAGGERFEAVPLTQICGLCKKRAEKDGIQFREVADQTCGVCGEDLWATTSIPNGVRVQGRVCSCWRA
jgi:hypothetical protein